MRDPLNRVRQFLGAVMGRNAPETEEPLPTPPRPQEHAANVEFMAECLFGVSAEQLGLTEVTVDDI